MYWQFNIKKTLTHMNRKTVKLNMYVVDRRKKQPQDRTDWNIHKSVFMYTGL